MSGRSTRELLAAGTAAATLAAVFYTCVPVSPQQTQESAFRSSAARSRRQLEIASPPTANRRGQNEGSSAAELDCTEPQLPPQRSHPPADRRVNERELTSSKVASPSRHHASATPDATPTADETVPGAAVGPITQPDTQCPMSTEHPPSPRTGSSRRLSVSTSAWVAAMGSTPLVRALPVVCVPRDAWTTVVSCCLPLSVEAAGQLCFETELERDWHHARGDRELLIGGWQARRERRQVGLDFVPCADDASRILSYTTDPGLPRPFNDTASVKVTETQTLHQLAGGDWVVASVATFEGLPKSDCLRVHTRYSFSSQASGAEARSGKFARPQTEVEVSVGAEWVAGVGVPWLLQRLLERKVLQDGQDALVDWERRVVGRAVSTVRQFSGNDLTASPTPRLDPQPQFESDAERHLHRVASKEDDFSKWSVAELKKEEEAILAELAALDAAATVPRQDQGRQHTNLSKTVWFHCSVL